MIEYTDNFNLIKPGQDEFYNVEIFNNNADIIDAELKNLKNTIENLNADGITLPDGKTISEKFTEITKEIGNTEELDTETKLSLVSAINEINQALVAHKADIASQEVGKGADIIGLPDPNNLFTSTNIGGAMQELFINVSNGKQLVGGAIADVDPNITIPTDATFQQLAEAIGHINTGKKWAKGSKYLTVNANNSQVFSIRGLAFKPELVSIGWNNVVSTRFKSGGGLNVWEQIVSTDSRFEVTDISIVDDGFDVTLRSNYSIDTGASFYWQAVE